jgi:hypothetical protein
MGRAKRFSRKVGEPLQINLDGEPIADRRTCFEAALAAVLPAGCGWAK